MDADEAHRRYRGVLIITLSTEAAALFIPRTLSFCRAIEGLRAACEGAPSRARTRPDQIVSCSPLTGRDAMRF